VGNRRLQRARRSLLDHPRVRRISNRQCWGAPARTLARLRLDALGHLRGAFAAFWAPMVRWPAIHWITGIRTRGACSPGTNLRSQILDRCRSLH